MKTLSASCRERLDDPAWAGSVPHTVQVGIRHYRWTNAADHTQGFTPLWDEETEWCNIELTEYLEREQLKPITEEIENDIDPNEAGYGTIKASQFAQEFFEETRDAEIYTKGSILKRVHTEFDTDHPYQFWGLGEETAGWHGIHLWEVVVRQGDTAGTDYVEHTYILGWVFDTAIGKPRWLGNKRVNPQTFTLVAMGLLGWLKDVDTAWLGDYSNKSGVYYDDSEDEAGNLEYADVCGYPVAPIVRTILEEAGVLDVNQSIKIPPDAGGNPDYSTLEAVRATSNLVAKQEQLNCFVWKTVGDVDYYVWVPVESSRKFYITYVNTVTGDVRSWESSALGTSGYTPVRLWYQGSGNVFYLLTKAATTYQYRVLTVIISGTTTSDFAASVANVALNYSATDITYYLQTDIDTVNNRLWATRHHDSALVAGSKVYLGYYNLSDGSWTLVQEYSLAETGDPARVWYDNDFSNDISAVGGLRVLYSHTDSVYGVMFLAWNWTGAEPDGRLYICMYDGHSETPYAGDDYDFTAYNEGGNTAYTHALQEVNYPIMGGRGSIGGFWDEGTNQFVFQLPSIEGNFDEGYASHQGVWKYWTPGDLAGRGSDIEVSGSFIMYRSFSSHGTANVSFSTGILTTTRVAFGEYQHWCKPVTFAWVSGAPRLTTPATNYHFQIADGTTSYPYRKWPLIGAPSITLGKFSLPNTGTKIEDRPFMIFKQSGTGGYIRAQFLTVFSDYWYANFNYDFITENPSIAEVLKKICTDYGLIGNFSLWSTVIKPRNDTGTIDKAITTNHVLRNAESDEAIEAYDGVSLTCSIDDTEYTYPVTLPNSKNILEVQSDFIMPGMNSGQKAKKRILELYETWRYKQAIYSLDAYGLPYLEPGDVVTFQRILPPGGNGYEIITGIVHRLTLDGTKNPLEVRSVFSGDVYL